VLDTHGDNYGRARTAVPPPDRFDDVERRLQMAIAANQAPGSLGRYTPVVMALQTELAQLNGEAMQGYANYTASAADPALPAIRCNCRRGPVSKRSTMTSR
jgi:hypothetical protein